MKLEPYQAAIVVLVIALIAFFTVRNETNTSKQTDPDFVLIKSDKSVGPSDFPLAVDPERVGSYPVDAKSGAGYFYDDVLEYRVWVHPEQKTSSPISAVHTPSATLLRRQRNMRSYVRR